MGIFNKINVIITIILWCVLLLPSCRSTQNTGIGIRFDDTESAVNQEVIQAELRLSATHYRPFSDSLTYLQCVLINPTQKELVLIPGKRQFALMGIGDKQRFDMHLTTSGDKNCILCDTLFCPAGKETVIFEARLNALLRDSIQPDGSAWRWDHKAASMPPHSPMHLFIKESELCDTVEFWFEVFIQEDSVITAKRQRLQIIKD
jgi:hypothetical protein